MSTAANVTIRLDTDLKKQAQKLFASMGLNLTVAIDAFLREAVRQQGLPFKASIQGNAQSREEENEKTEA